MSRCSPFAFAFTARARLRWCLFELLEIVGVADRLQQRVPSGLCLGDGGGGRGRRGRWRSICGSWCRGWRGWRRGCSCRICCVRRVLGPSLFAISLVPTFGLVSDAVPLRGLRRARLRRRRHRHLLGDSLHQRRRARRLVTVLLATLLDVGNVGRVQDALPSLRGLVCQVSLHLRAHAESVAQLARGFVVEARQLLAHAIHHALVPLHHLRRVLLHGFCLVSHDAQVALQLPHAGVHALRHLVLLPQLHLHRRLGNGVLQQRLLALLEQDF
mmetsp:Transcript_5178/g.9849  ORF Transcript_5178/g.9849 Transcript_5178/m.9849 type:complete len:271 (+) Transcript_5178:355-1167(+)